MTLALYLVATIGDGPLLELIGEEARHAVGVKRLTVGERALLSDGRGGIAEGEALEVARDRVVFAVRARRRDPEPVPRVVVVQALPKGDRADLAVEVLTELGVDEIVPWAAGRSVSQWRGSDKIERGLEKWRRTAQEAAKQSRRSRIPAVAGLAATGDVARRIASSDAAFVLHEEAADYLGGQRLPAAGEIALVVGPEGGITDQELAEFQAAGAHSVRLGPEVLRTSTAGAAALAVLSGAIGRWG